MDDRLSFQPGELRDWMGRTETKLGIDSEKLGKLLHLSGRTIRDWRREKYRPGKNAILKLHKISGIELPKYQVIPWKEQINRAARLGGKKTYARHGLMGTRESRVKGGVMSWYSRRKDPELLKKYLNTFSQPAHSEDLAELVGILLGDGGITFSQCVIYLNSETDKAYADYVKDLIKKLFGLTPKIYPHKRYKVLRVSISGVNLVKYLTSIGLCTGNKVKLQVAAPAWIWDKPEYMKACIRGLIDTDGCFVKHKYKVNGKNYIYHKIAFSNRSEPILDFVFDGLEKLGFTPKRPWKYQVWLHQYLEVAKYLREIGTRNYKPVVEEILGGVA